MRVLRRERAAGVDATLLAFLDWWEESGPFGLVVLRYGGLRSQRLQSELFAQGRTQPGPPCHCRAKPCPTHPLGLTVTNAALASQTPHGRAAALDAAPLVDGVVPWGDWRLFQKYGEAAERQGFVWGGRWKEPKDGPHIECPGWRTRPLPPSLSEGP